MVKIYFKVKKKNRNNLAAVTLFVFTYFCYVSMFLLPCLLNAQENTLTKKTNGTHDTLDNTLKVITTNSPSGIDTIINFYSSDTTIYEIRSKKIFLKGNASVDFKTQKLSAAIIEIDLDKKILYAKFNKDSTGAIVGVPKFNDNGEEFFGEELTYNLKTKTGLIKSGETKMGEGFYYGDSIRRISENELLVKNGYYTTCDAPKPHYHFGSSEMKMIVGDRIFADPLYFYVEDIPIFVIPFGLFLPITRGRSSGLIVPSFYFSNSRGVVFQNFGFYWATSDYWDAKITADLYTKGGYLFNLANSWHLKNIFTGDARVSFGKTRYSLDDTYSKEWSLKFNHEHIINPFERANINLDFASQDFNRNTSTNIHDRIKQNINSRASYSRTFENGINASLSFSNDQNIITGEYQGSIPLNITIPQFQPIKKIFTIPSNNWYSWIRDITFRYSGNAYYNFDKKKVINSYFDDTIGSVVYDTLFSNNTGKYISHSPQISISPKFGYFTVTPSINFNANNYFTKTNKIYNSLGSSIQEVQTNGFFTEYNYSFGVGVSTRIYGIADEKKKFFGIISPTSIGITAFRHTYQPSINISYSPDFSDSKYGFYGKYYDEQKEQEVIYSYFEKEGGMHASRQLQKRLSYSDMHSFEIKKKSSNDSLPDENLELLRISLSASYNFAADSLNFSDIGMSIRTPALKVLELSGGANFTLYDEIKVKNKSGNSEYYKKINEFLINAGKGIARVTNIRFDVSTAFSSDGLIDITNINTKTNGDNNNNLTKKTDTSSTLLGSRFLSRSQDDCDGDLFGLNSPGYSPLHLPWNINLGLTFNYNNSIIDKIDRSLDLNIGLNVVIAETWNISTRLHYDFIKKQVITPEINLTKDLHCWDLTANWYPIGYNRGFYLRFGIKSSQLKDLKIEKRDSPIFR